MKRSGRSVATTWGRLGQPSAATRLLLAWTLCYLILLQSVVGAMAAGGMAAHDGGGVLCAAGGPSPARGDTHDAVMRGLHCVLCPAAGAVPVLASPPRLPLPLVRIEGASAPAPAGIPPGAAPICENARSRAPPSAV